MTCIVAVKDKHGNITMGADSAGISGWDLTIRSDPKVFITGPYDDNTLSMMGAITQRQWNEAMKLPCGHSIYALLYGACTDCRDGKPRLSKAGKAWPNCK
jgi:hypothetical protein